MSIRTQFLIFAAVGAIGTLAHYCVLISLVQLLAVAPTAATAAGFAVGAVINYLLNYLLTFRSSASHKVAAPRFFAVALFGMAINTSIVWLGTTLAHVPYLVAQIFATGAVLTLGFTLNRVWTFSSPHKPEIAGVPQQGGIE